MPFYTPLRYPGGKRKLANYIKLVVKNNQLSDGHYVEMYAGGAAVALELLFGEFVSHIHINDLDRSIFAFWYTVVNQTEDLCTRVQEATITMDEWYRQKAIQANPGNTSLLDLGFSTIFLNRTNRSGIIQGGVIGGKNQNGPYKIGARFNRQDLIQRIRRIGRYRSRISIYNQDAADLIRNTLPDLPSRTLAYLDPPYYVKGKGLYRNYYEHADHTQIAALISNTNQRWIVSYDNAPEVRDLYSRFRSIAYDLHYSAANRYEGSEVMFFCDELVLPTSSSPTEVSIQTVDGAN